MPSDTVSVATTLTRIVGSDGARKSLTLQNIDDASYIDVTDDTGNGLRLYAHEGVTLSRKDGDDPHHRWNGIAEATANIRVLESFDKTYQRPKAETRQARTRSAFAGAPRQAPMGGGNGDGDGDGGGGGGGIKPK